MKKKKLPAAIAALFDKAPENDVRSDRGEEATILVCMCVYVYVCM
jgi:hypothetical protein